MIDGNSRIRRHLGDTAKACRGQGLITRLARGPWPRPTMHQETFLQDLAIIMMVAGLVTILCHRFKQPVVLGYILAGVIIGPHTPPFPLIQSQETIQTLSELGIIFLMFSLGLEFSLGKLREVGSTALAAATLEIVVMIG